MPTTVPAMKARLGNTDYYILSMKAKELADKVAIPRELPEWANMSIEERYQRDLNYARVRNHIAPYFANDDSRFFGAIIVAAKNFGEQVSFEPLPDITTKGLPGLYKSAAASMGFLTFSGGEVLVPLDGQHRIKAIQFAVTALDERGHGITEIPEPCTTLAQEDVTVILVPYEPKKARKIFTRVNRYAKPTTAGQNYVTDDDDIIAELAREVANKLIGGRLVKFTGNTLSPKNPEFTTLSIVYNCNDHIIAGNFPSKVDKTRLPEPEKKQLYSNKVQGIWKKLLKDIRIFADALSDPKRTGDDKRQEIRKSNLLGKPIAQECLVRAFVRLTNPPTGMSADEACSRLNALPWAITNDNLQVWDRVLWNGGTDGKIITKHRNLATDLISYLAGEKLSAEKKGELLDEYRKQFPELERKGKQLPSVSR